MHGVTKLLFRFLADNFDWLRNCLSEFGEDDYFIFDCPGQIEFFTHFTMLQSMIRNLEQMDMRLCCIYLVIYYYILDGCTIYR